MRRLIFVVLLGLTLAVSAQQCLPDFERLDCWPEPNASEQACRARGCTWCEAEIDGRNVPWCYLPESYGYKIEGDVRTTPNGFSLTLKRNTTISYFGNDANTLNFDAEFQSNTRLRIKITDGTPRFEVPIEIGAASGGNTDPLYEVQTSNSPVFSFKVVRKSTGAVLFDTSVGGFTFSNQFLQIATRLPTKNLYGIGENEQHSFRHKFDQYYTWPLYARDQPPSYNANMYGVHPRYTVLEEDGSAHGVVIVNSNAQEFITIPSPALLYRTIGGILDIYFFFGPTPENVVEQYTEAVGRAPIPPYWALGFHLSKYGYDELERMKGAVDRTAAAGIPQDVQYGDIDIMDRQLDFTVGARFSGLPAYVKELKAKGVKFVTILDPCISIGEPAGSYRPYELGNQMDVWMKRIDGTPVLGKVWPEDPVHFPDYSKNSTREWWITLIKEFKSLIDYDGLWIDMNEPANFVNGDRDEGCSQNSINNPPYVPGIWGGNLADKTACADHQIEKGSQYDTHNLYGWLESEPTRAGTLAANPGKRSFVLSRSTFIGSGKWVSHWLGDNFSQWDNMRYSIIGMLQFNQFGIPFVGADICGFINPTNATMCQRWQELGAFYPYSRNHNAIGTPEQDPAIWGPEVAESSRKALEIRYTILPYLYTLFHLHNTRGTTVARALWHEFPTDATAAGVDDQFLLGPGFLVSPVLEEGITSRDAYIPNARWFDYRAGTETFVRGRTVNLNAPRDYIPLHVRGGIIYPTQEPALNTVLSRLNPMGLIVALDDNDRSEGILYYDDGESLDSYESGKYYLARYIYENGNLETIVEHDGYSFMSTLKFQTVRLLGSNASRVSVNGKEIHMTKSAGGEILLSNLNLPANKPFQITFA
ncbi:unnamed protein product [Allacma fusca]|uniref:P-type domain-containing protein n=1 Tax=Allacma fusca TaxID=39272 RepID=A0A8J2PCV6_9HEXA|nr:unnamed protein product [Allacma fusca]